jgi:DNA-binding NarL/FixJ family response regulator
VLWDPPEELTRGVLTTLYRFFGRPSRTSPFPSRVERWLEDQRATQGLTTREAEIVAHVTRGAGNADVAERLHVAPGTVKRHLENVYRKLGLHSRGQLTALVVETLGAADTTDGDLLPS